MIHNVPYLTIYVSTVKQLSIQYSIRIFITTSLTLGEQAKSQRDKISTKLKKMHRFYEKFTVHFAD